MNITTLISQALRMFSNSKTNAGWKAALRWLMLLASIFQFLTGHAQTTAFTYQGRLNDNGLPANGIYDLQFALFDAETNGTQIGDARINAAMGVTNGLFTATLDFGNAPFDGSARWLEISVQTNGGDGFVNLTPRQEILPVPYAITAGSAASVSATNISGAIPDAQLSTNVALLNGNVNFSGAITATNFSGNGMGLSNINATQLTGTATNFSAGSITINSNLYLPATTSTGGIIYSGANTLIHTYGNLGFFAGPGAGNLTMIPGFPGDMGIGYNALHNNGGGQQNTAIGYYALFSNTSGNQNTAEGWTSLQHNTFGTANTANGYYAMFNNTDGNYNTADGATALYSNTHGGFNTAEGYESLYSNTSGYENTAVGSYSLIFNSIGEYNTAVGVAALYTNTTASYNTAMGFQALYKNTTGTNNIALGIQAGMNLTIGNNNIDLGNKGVTTENSTIRIGTTGVHTNTFIAGFINGDGGGLTNINANAIAGGITTNFVLTLSGSGTVTFYITNGIIMRIQ